jgi:hypothetical protein
MPKLYANVELVKRVADQVQAETIPATMRPGLTFRDAVLNSSDCLVEKAKYRFWNLVVRIMIRLKAAPIPAMMPYPTPGLRTLNSGPTEYVDMMFDDWDQRTAQVVYPRLELGLSNLYRPIIIYLYIATFAR